MNARQLRLPRWFPMVVFSLLACLILVSRKPQAFGHTPSETPHQAPRPALAQPSVVDATRMGEPVSLDQGLRFQSGDNLQWASPGCDDSAWPSFDPHRGTSDQNFATFGGFV
jgi:hypothetical protein